MESQENPNTIFTNEQKDSANVKSGYEKKPKLEVTRAPAEGRKRIYKKGKKSKTLLKLTTSCKQRTAVRKRPLVREQRNKGRDGVKEKTCGNGPSGGKSVKRKSQATKNSRKRRKATDGDKKKRKAKRKREEEEDTEEEEDDDEEDEDSDSDASIVFIDAVYRNCSRDFGTENLVASMPLLDLPQIYYGDDEDGLERELDPAHALA